MPAWVGELVAVGAAGVALVTRAHMLIVLGLWLGRMVWKAISLRYGGK